MLKIKRKKIIDKELYDEYIKTVFGFGQFYHEITKEQLYDAFKFHCVNQRIYCEVVDYIYDLIQKDKKRLERKKK